MKQAARLLLDGQISRRTFVSRMAQLGVAPVAAAGLAQTLAAAGPQAAAAPARVIRNATGGEIMAELLVDWDVRYVFGLGGSEEVGFLDALVDRVSLHYVQGLHESCVMAMADGYARASGETAFVNLHSVAGTAYALGQMVNAYKDRVPIVVTAGDQDTRIRGQGAFLEASNLDALPREYARWTWDVLNLETIPEVLRRAFLLARVPPGGPTFVTFSKDMWERRTESAEILPRARSQPENDLQPDPDAVRRAVDLLLAAEFPVIVAGRELGRFGGATEVREIAEWLGAPVFAELFASHTAITFPTTHPQYAGFFGEDPAFPSGVDAFWSAGGTMFTVMAPPPGPLLPRETRVVHTSVDGTELGRNYPVDIGMLANVRLAAAAMLEELRRRPVPAAAEARRARVEAHARGRRQKLQANLESVWDSRPIAGERLAAELNRRLEPDAILTFELVSEEPSADPYLDLNQTPEGRRMLAASGGCLGWAVPAAIGAKIAQPDRQVAALIGDGSFQFSVQAIWTAARYEVPVAVVIWNNGGYQANRRYLHQYGGRAAATGRYVGASLGAPAIDHVAIAQAYGVEAERIEDPNGLGAAIDRCLAAVASGRPYVLDVAIGRRFGGAESTWYDFFSVARRLPRQS